MVKSAKSSKSTIKKTRKKSAGYGGNKFVLSKVIYSIINNTIFHTYFPAYLKTISLSNGGIITNAQIQSSTISEESDHVIVKGKLQLTYNTSGFLVTSTTGVDISFHIVLTQKVHDGVRCLQITFYMLNITSANLIDKMKLLAFDRLFPSIGKDAEKGITAQFPLPNHILDFLFFDISSIIQKK